MNILVVAHYQNDGSPTASFIHDQVKAYCTLGHSVRVLSPIALGKKGFLSSNRIKGGHGEIDNIPHYYLRYLSLSNYGEKHFNTKSAISALKRKLSIALDNFRPDIIHAHTLGSDSEIGKWLKKKLGIPLVVTTHGSDTTVLVNEGRLDDLRQYCEGVDTIVAVSHALAERLQKCGTQTPIKTIHNGFNDGHLSTDGAKEPLTCLQVSNLIELKQIPVTIRAFGKLLRTYPEARLTIIGKGPDRELLEQLCHELNISHAVTFTGPLPHTDVLAHMGKTQFYIMPSVREGLPISYLEAMGSGCITIGTATEGISEIIRHQENGFLVQPGDSDAITAHVCSCIADPCLAEHIARNGEQTAMELTWTTNAQKLTIEFENLL